jgi:hypothetical protein
MDYLRVPKEVRFEEIRARDDVWSPSMFRRVIIPSSNVERIENLLHLSKPFDRGTEPGSMHYLRNSTHHFIRTKALQEHSYLLYPKGDAIIPINPKVFENPGLADGDILMSKDSNVGQCAMVNGKQCTNHMFSGAIVRIHPKINRYYFFAFLKHPLFKTQLLAMSPRGSTIIHAKTLWLDCLIPFPNQLDAEHAIRFVSSLIQAIVEKEKTIRDRSDAINNCIQRELEENQKNKDFQYLYPSISNVSSLGRFDAVIYDHEYKSKIWLIENYIRGYETPRKAGFTITPGPSLEIKIIRTRIDSEIWRPDYYTFLLQLAPIKVCKPA